MLFRSKKIFDEGYFYQGNKILPYCPRCGTGLASHEVAQGYEEITTDTVIVPFKKKDEDVYFLVWTTTPWTLISNVALCVNPTEKYILAEAKGHKFIVAEKLAKQVLEEYEVLETYTGTDLEHMEYEQLLPFLKVDKKAFFVTCGDYVTMDDGTGIVHIAPAFGEDDNQIGRKYNLPTLNPVTEDGKFNDGPWKDTLVFDADLDIIKWLKNEDKLFKKQKVKHNYPHCWRCHTPLIYYSKPSYYIEVTKIKDQLIENNKKVNWYPSYVGEKRFGNWLENINDWAISRNRYWGTPLPLWKCNDCNHEIMIGSKEELKNKSINKITNDIELHRPYVDEVTLKCDKCNSEMKRVTDVIDVWFDSGAMPFAQYHYPFENKELFEEQFPADYICEGIDQTRGWFYTLLVISTFVKGVAPYKNVLVNDLLLDKNGKKMSKSKGNTVEPFKAMEEYSADAVRWYLPYISPVWTPIKFDMNGLKEVYSKFFNPLKNTYNFFCLYANTDKIDIKDCNIPYEDREEIDKWLLSKYNKLVKYVTDSFEQYDLNKVVRSITDFVSEDLSNWYIRRNRNRFWDSDLNDSKRAVYITTYEVLVGLSKLIAPIIPYLSEEIYQKLTNEYSVHITDFPKVNKEQINEQLETKMDLVRSLISIGRMVREENKIKVRQPLSEVLIDGKNKNIINDLEDLILEELNVKNVTYVEDLSKYVNFHVKPNYKEVGRVFGPNIKEYAQKLEQLTKDEINSLQNNQKINLNINNEDYEINETMVDIRILEKEGFNVGMENNNFIILNTEINELLELEGNARELVSKIQNLRKERDFNITDRIKIYYESDDIFDKTITTFNDYIKTETLATDIIKQDNLTIVYDLNDYQVKLEIEKV